MQQTDKPRLILRDFRPADRDAFVAYQMEPRYRRLYDLGEDHAGAASELFDLFLAWQGERPRRNHQFGVFRSGGSGALLGCAGLRAEADDPQAAELGIELSPEAWGAYGVAIDATSALIDYGFEGLGLSRIIGRTASGNRRVERLARWFGASLAAERPGAEWMTARGWSEVDWVLERAGWAGAPRGRRAVVLPEG